VLRAALCARGRAALCSALCCAVLCAVLCCALRCALCCALRCALAFSHGRAVQICVDLSFASRYTVRGETGNDFENGGAAHY